MIQWFPGHMAKAFKQIQELAPVSDLFVIVLDARAPMSTYNEDFDKIQPDKPRLFVITKLDLADQSKLDMIMSKFNNKNDKAILVNLKKKSSTKKIKNEIHKLLEPKKERDLRRGILKPRLHVLVIGVPNSGKSTLINLLAGKNKTKVGNKPGVTRGKQWISIDDMQLLDTPGILWPKFENEMTAIKLAVIGSIKLSIMPLQEIFYSGYKLLSKYYPEKIIALNLEPEITDESKIYNNLYTLCVNKNFILKDNQSDNVKGMTYFMNYIRDLKGVTYD